MTNGSFKTQTQEERRDEGGQVGRVRKRRNAEE